MAQEQLSNFHIACKSELGLCSNLPYVKPINHQLWAVVLLNHWGLWQARWDHV